MKATKIPVVTGALGLVKKGTEKYNEKRFWITIKLHAPVVQTLDSAIHWINHYPLDNSIGFACVYPLDSDLSGGKRYPSFEPLGPELQKITLLGGSYNIS